MGKVTQLIFGVAQPGQHEHQPDERQHHRRRARALAPTCSPTSRAAICSGAHPRKQFLAQFAGIFVGHARDGAPLPVMVPERQRARHRPVPAPAAQTWSAVAVALRAARLARPREDLVHRRGGLVGHRPRRFWRISQARAMDPSAAGVGLAWTFHWYYRLLFLLGAAGVVVERKRPSGPRSSRFPWRRAGSPGRASWVSCSSAGSTARSCCTG